MKMHFFYFIVLLGSTTPLLHSANVNIASSDITTAINTAGPIVQKIVREEGPHFIKNGCMYGGWAATNTCGAYYGARLIYDSLRVRKEDETNDETWYLKHLRPVAGISLLGLSAISFYYLGQSSPHAHSIQTI